MAGPGSGHLERFECWHALPETRPDRLIEIGVIDLPVEPRRLVVARVATNVAGSLWPEADIATDMPGQRHRLELLADLEVKGQAAHRRDRHLHAELAAQFRAPAIGRINDGLGREPLARPEAYTRDALAGDFEIDNPVLPVADAEARGFPAKSHQHTVRVHIAVVGRESGDIDVVDPHRRKAVLDALAVE